MKWSILTFLTNFDNFDNSCPSRTMIADRSDNSDNSNISDKIRQIGQICTHRYGLDCVDIHSHSWPPDLSTSKFLVDKSDTSLTNLTFRQFLTISDNSDKFDMFAIARLLLGNCQLLAGSGPAEALVSKGPGPGTRLLVNRCLERRADMQTGKSAQSI